MKNELVSMAAGLICGLAFAGLPVSEGLSFHGDASDAASLTVDDNGSVTEWRSQRANQPSLKPGYLAGYDPCYFPNATNEVKFVTEEGRAGVRLSHLEGGNVVGAVLSFGKDVTVKIGTAFCVTRPIGSGSLWGALVGRPGSYAERFQRNSGVRDAWNDDNYNNLYVNGTAGGSFAAYGEGVPHLVSFSSKSGTKLVESVGGAYLCDGTKESQLGYVAYRGVVHELVIYDRILSSEEIESVNGYLMRKWKLDGWTARWTGSGQTKDWGDAGNWECGSIPTSETLVETAADMQVDVTTDIVCKGITNIGPSRVSVSFECNGNHTFSGVFGGSIDLEKKGTGVLKAKGLGGLDGQVTVAEGRFVPFTLPVTKGLSFHGDANDLASLDVDENGSVTEWRSQRANQPSLKPGYLAGYDPCYFPNATNEVKFVTEEGRAGVRLSHLEGGNFVYAVLSFGKDVTVKIGTAFCVTRPIGTGTLYGAIVGRPASYAERFQRNSGVKDAWNDDNYNNLYVNGTAGGSFAAYGEGVPHLVSFSSKSGTKLVESVGGAYLCDGTKESQLGYVAYRGVVHELVIYDRILSSEEIESVNGYLIAKWGLDGTVTRLTDGNYVVRKGAVLDVSGIRQIPGSVSGEGSLDFNGPVELNGGVLSVGSLIGSGILVNSSDRAATIAVSTAEDLTLSCSIKGKINLVKEGEGELTLPESDFSGSVTLRGGSLKGEPRPVESFGAVSVHLDASAGDSIVTNGLGYLEEWHSSDPGKTIFKGADEIYGDLPTFHNNPYVATDAEGRRCVRFGRNAAHELVGSFIAKSDKSQISAQTFFMVMRSPEDAGWASALLGMIYGYDYRMTRSDYSRCRWSKRGMDEAWVNGKKSESENDVWFEASGYTKPHLLVVRNNSSHSFDIFGGQYLFDVGSSVPKPVSVVGADLEAYEILFFNERLDDEAVSYLTQHLMQKWDIPEQAEIAYEPTLPDGLGVRVENDATLNYGGPRAPVRVSSLAVDAAGAQSVPCLTLIGSLLANDPLCVLGFENTAGVKDKSSFLVVDGEFDGSRAFDENIGGLSQDAKVKFYEHNATFVPAKGIVIVVR